MDFAQVAWLSKRAESVALGSCQSQASAAHPPGGMVVRKLQPPVDDINIRILPTMMPVYVVSWVPQNNGPPTSSGLQRGSATRGAPKDKARMNTFELEIPFKRPRMIQRVPYLN